MLADSDAGNVVKSWLTRPQDLRSAMGMAIGNWTGYFGPRLSGDGVHRCSRRGRDARRLAVLTLPFAVVALIAIVLTGSHKRVDKVVIVIGASE